MPPPGHIPKDSGADYRISGDNQRMRPAQGGPSAFPVPSFQFFLQSRTLPAAPTGLSASVVTHESVTLTWETRTMTASRATGYSGGHRVGRCRLHRQCRRCGDSLRVPGQCGQRRRRERAIRRGQRGHSGTGQGLDLGFGVHARPGRRRRRHGRCGYSRKSSVFDPAQKCEGFGTAWTLPKTPGLGRCNKNRCFCYNRNSAQQGAGRKSSCTEKSCTRHSLLAGGVEAELPGAADNAGGLGRGAAILHGDRLQVGGPGFCLALDAVRSRWGRRQWSWDGPPSGFDCGHCNPRPRRQPRRWRRVSRSQTPQPRMPRL